MGLPPLWCKCPRGVYRATFEERTSSSISMKVGLHRIDLGSGFASDNDSALSRHRHWKPACRYQDLIFNIIAARGSAANFLVSQWCRDISMSSEAWLANRWSIGAVRRLG